MTKQMEFNDIFSQSSRLKIDIHMNLYFNEYLSIKDYVKAFP